MSQVFEVFLIIFVLLFDRPFYQNHLHKYSRWFFIILELYTFVTYLNFKYGFVSLPKWMIVLLTVSAVLCDIPHYFLELYYAMRFIRWPFSLVEFLRYACLAVFCISIGYITIVAWNLEDTRDYFLVLVYIRYVARIGKTLRIYFFTAFLFGLVYRITQIVFQ